MSNSLSGARFLLVQGEDDLSVVTIRCWSEYPTEKRIGTDYLQAAQHSDDKRRFARELINEIMLNLVKLRENVQNGRLVPIGETKEMVLEKIDILL